MKICYVITRLKGGAGNYVRDLAVNLADHHNITVVCGPGSDEKMIEEIQEKNVKVILLPLLMHFNPLYLMICIANLFLLFRREKFDIIHTNSTEAGIVGRLSSRLAGIRSIHTNHGISFENRNFLHKIFLILAEKIAALSCSTIIDISNNIKIELEKRNIGRNKHIVVPLGIEIEKFRKAKKINNLTRMKDPFVIGCIALLSKRKRVHELIKITNEIVAGGHRNVHLVIVGDGPERTSLEKIVEYSDNVQFLGFREDIPNLLKSFDIFVLLSEREGTPIVIYEAMASGLPVVATDVGGIRDQVQDGNTGYLLENTKEASSRILGLMTDNTLREQMGKNALKKIKEFTLDNMVKKTLQIYR